MHEQGTWITFLKLLAIFLLGCLLVIFAFYGWDFWNDDNSMRIGGGGYDLTDLYAGVVLIIYLIAFNLFLFGMIMRGIAKKKRTDAYKYFFLIPISLLSYVIYWVVNGL